MNKNGPLETNTKYQYGKDLVSIIIPVYNVEKYIARCIISVIGQTYANIEIILVDDGSKDESGKICDEYSHKDSRIKVIHNENSGVSVARNEGIKLAKGEFLVFVDSDDYLEQDAIETLINKQQEQDFDFVIGKKSIYRKEKREIPDFVSMELFDEANADKIFNILSLDGIYAPFAKLYKNDIIKANRLSFKKGVTMGEDAIFVFEYIEKTDSIAIVDKVVYNYEVENQNSASRKCHKEFYKYNKILIDIIKNIVCKSKNNQQIYNEFEDYVVNRVANVLLHYLYYNTNRSQTAELVENTIETHQEYIDFERFKNIFTKKETKYLKNKEYKKFVLIWNLLRGYRFLKCKVKIILIRLNLLG